MITPIMKIDTMGAINDAVDLLLPDQTNAISACRTRISPHTCAVASVKMPTSPQLKAL